MEKDYESSVGKAWMKSECGEEREEKVGRSTKKKKKGKEVKKEEEREGPRRGERICGKEKRAIIHKEFNDRVTS